MKKPALLGGCLWKAYFICDPWVRRCWDTVSYSVLSKQYKGSWSRHVVATPSASSRHLPRRLHSLPGRRSSVAFPLFCFLFFSLATSTRMNATQLMYCVRYPKLEGAVPVCNFKPIRICPKLLRFLAHNPGAAAVSYQQCALAG